MTFLIEKGKKKKKSCLQSGSWVVPGAGSANPDQNQWCGSGLIVSGSGSTKYDEYGSGSTTLNKMKQFCNTAVKMEWKSQYFNTFFSLNGYFRSVIIHINYVIHILVYSLPGDQI